ncbi:MAG: hypothetical protein GKS05_00315 [Nitrospirales bacterium]|nr:hypothetical protein [Nitrospirales bacterium]NKB80343.1 hypothetical protein [Nitrospirales bacterium]
MPKAKREKNCATCEDGGSIRMSFMVCGRCAYHFCSRHGDPNLEECTTCLDGAEDT